MLTHVFSTLWSTNTFAISPTIIRKFYALWENLADSAGSCVDSMAYIQSVPPCPSRSNPNSLGLPLNTRPESDFVLFQTTFSYMDPNLTQALEQKMKEFARDVDAAAESEGVFVDWKYGNYAAGLEDVYGDAEVKERLRSVSRRYDPEGMMQRLVVGGWKLFERGDAKE